MAARKRRKSKKASSRKKLHGAALKAHRARMARKGHHYGKGKRVRAKRAKRCAPGCAPKRRRKGARSGHRKLAGAALAAHNKRLHRGGAKKRHPKRGHAKRAGKYVTHAQLNERLKPIVHTAATHHAAIKQLSH